MIIVASLEASQDAFKRHKPGFVISILRPDEAPPPIFDSVPAKHHLILSNDCSRRSANVSLRDERCAEILALAEQWRQLPSPRAPILIHCHQGVARSMAVAYILMCAIEDGACEKKIATRLRNAAPHADPNVLLVSEADQLLGRDDRMVEAILDLCPCCNADGAQVVELPVAA